MIAAIFLTALLAGVLVYAWKEYRRSPAVAFLSVLAALLRALFRLGAVARHRAGAPSPASAAASISSSIPGW